MVGSADERPELPATVSGDEAFFSSLPEVTDFEEVIDRARYVTAPDSWFVVITDVVGSTGAIEAGRYREVNALGVAGIIAVRNAIPDLQLPYVFGGDGATLLVPGSRLEPAERALRGLRALSAASFELELRVARVSVEELRNAGHAVRVERYRLSEGIALGMFSGSGITTAETWVKDPTHGAKYAVPEGETQTDLDGFECRWEPMPSKRGVVVSLLVVALEDSEQRQQEAYQRVLRKLDDLLGDASAAPVSLSAMQLKGVFGDYSIEAKLRSDGKATRYKAASRRARKQTAVGRLLNLVGGSLGGFDGAAYQAEFLENSDFRKFDETLRMVIDLTLSEAKELEAWLADEHERGTLAFGVHRSEAALATCMVKAYRGDHVHFIDGSDGGYALAAKGLKAQLADS